MPTQNHADKVVEQVACAVGTVSDTRTPETDQSGSLIRESLAAAGHRVVYYEIVADDPARVRDLVLRWCEQGDCQAVLLTGGTGLAERDSTFEAVSGLLAKKLDGFGELFRMLSFEEVGSSAMLSRALAGVCRDTVVFSMPGSPAAVRLALNRLILPELGHIAALLGK